jgi:hypothetical protein
MGRPLEPVYAVGFWLRPVELQFSVGPGMFDQYRNLRPVNWSGTDAIWFKSGDPLSSPWHLYRKSGGIGLDGPEQGNAFVGMGLVAYYDNPGLHLSKIHEIGPNVTWVWLAQNFTGWVEGQPIRGGPAERLCDVVAWWSIVSVANSNWQGPVQSEDWNFTTGTDAGTGWTNTSKAAPV